MNKFRRIVDVLLQLSVIHNLAMFRFLVVSPDPAHCISFIHHLIYKFKHWVRTKELEDHNISYSTILINSMRIYIYQMLDKILVILTKKMDLLFLSSVALNSFCIPSSAVSIINCLNLLSCHNQNRKNIKRLNV